MTALDQYLWLEATGTWREGPGADVREVIVRFGNATLILTDLEEVPLAHWALAGLRVVGRENGATVFSTTDDGAETLAIRDPEMLAAIAAVGRGAIPRPVPKRRPWFGLAAALALVAAAVTWVPGLIRAQAVRMLPPEQAAEFGDRMLLKLMEAGGGLCDGTAGRRALARLATTLAPDAPPRVRVLRLDGAPAAALPGNTVLLDRDAIADAARPEVVAGWIALADGRAPEAAMMQTAGLIPAARYVFTGDLPDSALTRAAEAAVAGPGPDEAEAALARLAEAGLDGAAFADALRQHGIEPWSGGAPPEAPEPPAAALNWAEWAAVTEICG